MNVSNVFSTNEHLNRISMILLLTPHSWFTIPYVPSIFKKIQTHILQLNILKDVKLFSFSTSSMNLSKSTRIPSLIILRTTQSIKSLVKNVMLLMLDKWVHITQLRTRISEHRNHIRRNICFVITEHRLQFNYDFDQDNQNLRRGASFRQTPYF